MAVWSLIAFCDQYIEQEEPWKGEDGSSVVVADLLFVVGKISDLLGPFLPQTSQKIREQIKSDKKAEGLFPRLR